MDFLSPSVPVTSEAAAAPDSATATSQGAICTEELQAVAEQLWPMPFRQLAAARCLAKAGELDAALDQVSQSVRHPAFRDVRSLAADADLSPLHETAAWDRIMAEAERKSLLSEAAGSGVDIRHMRRNLPKLPSSVQRGELRQVVLLVWVSPDAQPARIDIERSSGDPQVDAAAVQAASGWRYIAAISAGETFGFPMRLPIDFQR